MADQTVGVLKAVLAADTAEFSRKMADASADVRELANKLQADLEPRQRAVNAAVRDFLGGTEIRKAQEYAQAVEKIGGASVLTAADQQKVNKAVTEALDHYRKLGVEGPANLVKLEAQTRQVEKSTGLLDQQWAKLAASFGAGVLIDRAVSGLVSFGKAAIEDAGRVVDLADKTGLSTRAVQVYGEAAKQAGGTVENMADAVFKLGVNLEKGGDQAKSALGALGLSLKQVQDLKPEQQFELIAEKLKNVSSAQERNRLGVDLFGKSWASVAPAVVAGIDGIADSMTIMGDAQVRALDKAADAWDQFWEDTKRKTAATLGDIVVDVQAATSGWSKFAGDIAATGSGLISGGLSGAKEGHAAYIAALQAQAKAAQDAAAAGKENEQQTRKGREAAEDAAKATADAAAKAKQWANEIQNLGNKLSGANIDLEIQKMAAAVHALKGQIDAGQLPALVKQLQEWRDTGRQLPPVLEAIRKAQQDLNVALKSAFAFDTEAKTDRINALVKPLDPTKVGKNVALPDNPTIAQDQRLINQQLSEAFAAIAHMADQAVKEHQDASTDAAKAWQDRFASIGTDVLSAITGGGNVAVGVGSAIGKAVGEAVQESVTKALVRSLGEKIGNVIGGMIPVLGALVGPLVGMAIDKIKEGPRVNKLRDEFKKQFGDAAGDGLQAVIDKWNDPTLTAAYDRLMHTGKLEDFQDATKDLNQRLGELGQQAQATADAITNALGAIGPATANIVAGFTEKLKPGLKALEELRKKQEELKKDDRSDPRDAEKVAAELKAKTQQIVEGNQGEFDRLSRIALAGFNAFIGQGQNAAEAIKNIGPAIDALKGSADAFGFAGNAAYDQLSRWSGLVEGNQPLLDQVSGLNELMSALSTLGALNAETFADMQAQGVQAFADLTAAGFTQQEALTQMKPLLESIVAEHEKSGRAIDAETQKLIDQARADGILKGKQIDTNRVLMDGLGKIITLLGGELPKAWSTMADSAEDAADRVQGALDGIEAPSLEIPVSFRTNGQPDTSGYQYDGPQASGDDATGFAGGSRGLRDFDPAGEWRKLHGREEVLNAGQSEGVASMVRDALAGAGGSTTVIFEEDGRTTARYLLPHIEGEVRRLRLDTA